MKKGKKTYVALALAATCITGFLGGNRDGVCRGSVTGGRGSKRE